MTKSRTIPDLTFPTKKRTCSDAASLTQGEPLVWDGLACPACLLPAAVQASPWELLVNPKLRKRLQVSQVRRQLRLCSSGAKKITNPSRLDHIRLSRNCARWRAHGIWCRTSKARTYSEDGLRGRVEAAKRLVHQSSITMNDITSIIPKNHPPQRCHTPCGAYLRAPTRHAPVPLKLRRSSLRRWLAPLRDAGPNRLGKRVALHNLFLLDWKKVKFATFFRPKTH